MQRTDRYYSERAVFTARVIQLLGKAYNLDGERESGAVLAVVHHRYWGLPWYWPRVVVLDGGFFCGIAIRDGEEYLVSGYRERYGVLYVGTCSRTQPLKTAVDLHTLDGSLCAAPGGAIIGHVSEAAEAQREGAPVRNAVLTFRDSSGKAYVTQSDSEGIYELRHLPPGPYTLDSRFAPGQYLRGWVSVESGICKEAQVQLSPDSLTGR
jgi:hypothetical protein